MQFRHNSDSNLRSEHMFPRLGSLHMVIALICSSLLALACTAHSGEAGQEPEQPASSQRVSIPRALDAALSRYNRGDYDAALESLEPALENSPQYIPIWQLKAKIHYAEGNHAATDEAVQVCLASTIDAETATLAFRNSMEWPDISSEEKIRKYAELTSILDPDVFAVVLGDLVQRYADFSLAAKDLSAAWRQCALQPESAVSIVEKYSRQEMMSAATLLSQSGIESELGSLAGPLNYLIGKRLSYSDNQEEALSCLERSLNSGFAPGEASELAGRILSRNRQDALAAETLVSGWRFSRDPGNAAALAIDALVKISEYERGLSLADTALAAFPRHPALQARRLLLLHCLKRQDEALAYSKYLEDNQSVPGVRYGNILIARHDGVRIDISKELDQIAEYANTRLGYNLEFETVENWLEYGPRSMDLSARNEASRLMTLGRQFWNEGNRNDALAVWHESISYAQPGASATLLSTALFLANEEMPTAAFDLLDRYAPSGFNPMDLASTLAEQKRWNGVKALFDRYGTEDMRPGSWPDLLNAIATINQGTIEEAEKAVAELVRHPVETQSLVYRYLDDHGKWRIGEMTLEKHRKLRTEIEELALQRHYTSMYGLFLSSPQWRHDREGKSDPVYVFGTAMLKYGENDKARDLFSKILAQDPGHPGANLFMALVEQRAGNEGLARQHVSAGIKRAKGFNRVRLLSLQARDWEEKDREISYLLECLRLQPDDDEVRLEAVRGLASEYRYIEARKVLRHFEKKQRRDEDVISSLALSYLEVGEYKKALEKWRWLVVRYPDSIPPLAGLGVTLNNLEEFAKCTNALAEKAIETKDLELCALLAESNSALGEYEDVIKWVNHGLVTDPKNLRLLGLGATAAEALECDNLMEQYAGRYIAIDFESPPMQGIYVQALVNQKKWDCVERHDKKLIDKNGMNWAALEHEADRLNARTDRDMMRDVYKLDRMISEAFDNDPSLLVRYGISAAGAAEFKKSFRTLYEMVGHGPNSTVISLYFSRVTLVDNRGAVKIDKVKAVLDTLTSTPAYRYASISGLGKRMPRQLEACPVPILPIFGNSKPEALRAVDDLLQSRGGRACLVIGEEALTRKTPDLADVDFLLRLADTGRWEFILTDNRPARLPGIEEDKRTDFWTEAAWNGSCRETQQEMRKRLKKELNRLLRLANKAEIPISAWLHPSWGDYGQRRITGDLQASATYSDVIAQTFPIAFTQTPSGYYVPGGNCWRVPMRVVGSGVDPVLLEESLRYGHPTRRAVLELAKVKSWHTQFDKANELFCLARTYGLNPKEISYFQGRNSQFAGDVPIAIDLSHEAWAFDPGAERVDKLIDDTHRLLRPLLVSAPRYWTDSNEDAYTEALATLSFHVTTKLELRIGAGAHRWENGDDGQKMHGQSLSLGFRYYFKPMQYFMAELRGVNVGGEGTSYAELHTYWHGRYTMDSICADGFFNLEYHREGIESYKAQRGKIRANRFVASTSTRIADRWDIDLNAYYTNRTDGNDTIGMLFRPMYRFSDRPEFRFGYWFAAADSDRNPDEYYAPVKYMAHQLVATYQHNITEKLSVNALGSYGRAKTEDTGWRTVMRANAGVAYRFNDCVNISGGYQYLKLPDYTLRQYTAALEVRF